MNNLLTIQDTASYLHVSISTLYRWVHHKKIEHIKVGSRVLFTREYLEEFIKLNTIQAAA
ncbi:MAG: helix-turn-helix domain-containing protein [Candidatus Gastranaerophilaceae bacterium]